MNWTFDSYAFTWLRRDRNSMPVQPAWRQMPALVKRPLLGLRDTDIAQIGWESAVLDGPIYVAAVDLAGLIARNGAEGNLSDGASTWRAVLELDVATLRLDADGATGTATFTRTTSD